MKNKLLISLVLVALAGASLWARQTPPKNTAAPCNDTVAAADKKKDVVEHDPLADPIEELRTRAQKKIDEKNFKELQSPPATPSARRW